MYVVTRSARSHTAGLGDLGQMLTAMGAASSPTMVYPPNQARVAQALQESQGWYLPHGSSPQRIITNRGFRGLGLLDTVPQWVWWGAGGLAAGGILGYFLLK